MFLVDLLICVPLSGQKRMLLSNYFPIEESGQCWIIISQTLDHQIATELSIFFVHVLEDNFHVVAVPLTFLVTAEPESS